MKTIIIDGVEYNLTPKVLFKEEDWITNGEYTWKVTDIKPLDYILQSQKGEVVDDTISYVDEEFHLWTIQDSKDGDVLVVGDEDGEGIAICGKDDTIGNNNLHCVYDDENGFIVNVKIAKECLLHPATKEQRDFLFQKMKEAGYEWDAEKKELKKIKQKPIWSEEDEDALDIAIRIIQNGGDDCAGILDSNKALRWLKSIKDRVQLQPKQEWSEEEDNKIAKELIRYLPYCDDISKDTKERWILWLKSFKPQNHWKPSEVQMEALKFVVDYFGELTEHFVEYDEIKSLYNNLKGLNLC